MLVIREIAPCVWTPAADRRLTRRASRRPACLARHCTLVGRRRAPRLVAEHGLAAEGAGRRLAARDALLGALVAAPVPVDASARSLSTQMNTAGTSGRAHLHGSACRHRTGAPPSAARRAARN
eukprot:3026817-Prymnesium_polylepis.1